MPPNQSQAGFLFCLFGVVVGVGLRTLTLGVQSVSILGGVVLIGFATMVVVLVWHPRRLVLVVGICMMVGFTLGWWRADMRVESVYDGQLDQWYGQEVELFGQVVGEPDMRRTNTKLTVSVERVCQPECSEASGRVLVTVAATKARYGDTVWVEGRLREPENFTSDTGREFDYVNYLAKDGIRGTMQFVEVEVLETGGGNLLQRNLFDVKERLVASLSAVMPAPAAWLGAGIVYGEKQALGGDWSDIFRAVGLMHLVVLSGYNVTIIAEGVRRALMPIGFRASAFLGIVGVILFAMLVGGGSTIIRASIMAILVVVAKLLGRPAAAWRLLLLAGVAMLLANPLVLWYDLSFQLSFLATLGLIYLAPWFEKKLSWMTNALQLREHAAVTLSAQVAVLPLLAVSMGEVSLVAPLVNMLVLPVIPLAMLGVALVSVFGLVFVPLAQLVMVPTAGLLSYVLTVAEWVSRLPFAVWEF